MSFRLIMVMLGTEAEIKEFREQGIIPLKDQRSFSFYCIEPGRQQEFDPRNLQRGKYACLITNAQLFIDQVFDACTAQEIQINYGVVKYSDNPPIMIFNQFVDATENSYRHEFIFEVNNGQQNCLTVGNLSDLVMEPLPSKLLENMKFKKC